MENGLLKRGWLCGLILMLTKFPGLAFRTISGQRKAMSETSCPRQRLTVMVTVLSVIVESGRMRGDLETVLSVIVAGKVNVPVDLFAKN